MQRRLGTIFIIAGVLCLIAALKPGQLWSGWGFGFGFSMKEFDREKTVAAAGVRRLDIETASTTIRLARSDDEQIHLSLRGRAGSDAAERTELRAETRGDRLAVEIEQPSRWLGVHSLSDSELTIALPEQEWKSVELKTGSGDVALERLRGEKLTLKTGSGNIRVSGLQAADELNVETGSGNAEVTDFEGKAARLQTGSGDIKAANYRLERLTFEASSGNVTLENGRGKLKGETASGNIELAAEKLTDDTELEASSGNIRIALAAAPASLALDYEGRSGQGKVAFEGIRYTAQSEERNTLKGVFGNGQTKLAVRTSSGDFTLGPR